MNAAAGSDEIQPQWQFQQDMAYSQRINQSIERTFGEHIISFRAHMVGLQDRAS